jgi:hypothetical protein
MWKCSCRTACPAEGPLFCWTVTPLQPVAAWTARTRVCRSGMMCAATSAGSSSEEGNKSVSRYSALDGKHTIEFKLQMRLRGILFCTQQMHARSQVAPLRLPISVAAGAFTMRMACPRAIGL